MNEFEGLLSSPWVQALGWTLLHSVWQSILVSIVVMLAMRFIPSRFSTSTIPSGDSWIDIYFSPFNRYIFLYPLRNYSRSGRNDSFVLSPDF